MKKPLHGLYPNTYPADNVEVDIGEYNPRPTQTGNMIVKIKGMRPVPGEVDTFELQNVAMRQVDWDAVRTAMGLPQSVKGDKLLDKLGAVMWRYDIMEELKRRMK